MPHFPLSDKQTDAVIWALWEDRREANGGASPLCFPCRCLASPTIAWPITHLAFDWTAAAERVLVITVEKSHFSLPWQLFLLLSSTGKQSWQINRTQAGSLFLGYSNCCLKHKPNELSYTLRSKLCQRNINCCPRKSICSYLIFNCDRPHNSSTSPENLWPGHLPFFIFWHFNGLINLSVKVWEVWLWNSVKMMRRKHPFLKQSTCS